MIFLYVLLTVYIAAVNFYGFRFIKLQRDSADAGETPAGDGRLSIYISMFAMRYRLSSFVLMVFLPLLAVFNLYCFYMAYRMIWLFL